MNLLSPKCPTDVEEFHYTGCDVYLQELPDSPSVALRVRVDNSVYGETGARMQSSLTAVRVLLVEDYQPFRHFVRATLEARPGLQVIGEASDGFEGVQKAAELHPDLILLDLGLPTLNGIEAAHQISRLVPAATILFVSQNSDAEIVNEVLSNGAKGYVRKEDASSDLMPAIEAALRGQRFVSKTLSKDALPIQ